MAEANATVTSDEERIQMLESMIKEKDETIKRPLKDQQELAMERLRVEIFSKDYSMIIFYTFKTGTSMTSNYFKMSVITCPSRNW